MATTLEKQLQKALELLQNEGPSPNLLFPKEKLKVRLFADRDGELLRPVKSVYQGKEKTKFVFLAFNVEDTEPRWKGLVVPKTVARAILALSTEFQIFDEKGHGIMIIKTGEGLKTVYSVTPSKNAVAIPDSLLKNLPSLADFAAEYEEYSMSRSSSSGNDEDEDQKQSFDSFF